MTTMNSTSAPPALINGSQCAAICSLSLRSWQRLVAQGKAPQPVHLGRLVRWRSADVEAFVAALASRSP